MKIQGFINSVAEIDQLPPFTNRPNQVVLGVCPTDQGSMTLLRSIDGEYFLENARALYQITDTAMIERRIRRGR